MKKKRTDKGRLDNRPCTRCGGDYNEHDSATLSCPYLLGGTFSDAAMDAERKKGGDRG